MGRREREAYQRDCIEHAIACASASALEKALGGEGRASRPVRGVPVSVLRLGVRDESEGGGVHAERGAVGPRAIATTGRPLCSASRSTFDVHGQGLRAP